MKKKLFFIPLFVVGLVALVIWAFMLLWNWLMPLIFDLIEITFWQAGGLLLLAKLLFGGFHSKKSCCSCGSSKSGGSWKRKFKQKWNTLSVEDKQKWETKFCGKGIAKS